MANEGNVTEQDVEKMLTNPVYTGIGPYPRIIPDEQFIRAAENAIKELGIARYMTSVLANLRESFPPETT